MRKSLLLLMAAVTIVSAIAQTQLPRALIITGNGNVPTYKKEYPPWIHEFQNDKVKQILQGIATVEVSENLNVLNLIALPLMIWSLAIPCFLPQLRSN